MIVIYYVIGLYNDIVVYGNWSGLSNTVKCKCNSTVGLTTVTRWSLAPNINQQVTCLRPTLDCLPFPAAVFDRVILNLQ